jgi:adenine phosphoribosyltransferase
MNLKDHIAPIPDFPKPGILFYDISPLLAHPAAWRTTVEQMADRIARHKPQVLAGIESRGFLVAAPLALHMGLGFVMLRKKGKLPGKTVPYTYDLEYGQDTIEIQEGAIAEGDRVVLLDDLLATGGVLHGRDAVPAPHDFRQEPGHQGGLAAAAPAGQAEDLCHAASFCFHPFDSLA